MRRVSRRLKPDESSIQSSYIVWLNLQYPHIADVTASFPNGGKRTPRYGAKLRREGLKKGIPDVGIFYPTMDYPGMFIEFKKEDGVVKDEQIAMMKRLSDVGYFCVVCRSLEDAMLATRGYLKNAYPGNE
jgi:hypothetical protein